jgi:oxygen-independent coproporphyrinogen-3 oxidase
MIIKEIGIQVDYLENSPVETIYFGGGSPSLLPVSDLERILSEITAKFTIAADPEITLEANPDDLTAGYLKDLRAAGINRLSIGIQSFDNNFLKFLNRIHDGEAAVDCIKNARIAGFDNISIDLIYGIPSDDHSIFRSDLQTAIELETEHLSAYCLTIEPKTVFGKWEKTGKIKPASDEFAATQFEMLLDETEKNGIYQYEISNFSREGYYSRHNTSYWNGSPYLGIGPGAHSYNKISRQFNISSNQLYIKSVEEGKIPFTKEDLSMADKINDYLLTRLRTRWGADLEVMKEHFDFSYSEIKSPLEKAERLGLISIENNIVTLTRKGKFLADEITSELMIS